METGDVTAAIQQRSWPTVNHFRSLNWKPTLGACKAKNWFWWESSGVAFPRHNGIDHQSTIWRFVTQACTTANDHSNIQSVTKSIIFRTFYSLFFDQYKMQTSLCPIFKINKLSVHVLTICRWWLLTIHHATVMRYLTKPNLITELHCVSKKVPTFKLSVTLSSLNRFSKFLRC